MVIILGFEKTSLDNVARRMSVFEFFNLPTFEAEKCQIANTKKKYMIEFFESSKN